MKNTTLMMSKDNTRYRSTSDPPLLLFHLAPQEDGRADLHLHPQLVGRGGLQSLEQVHHQSDDGGLQVQHDADVEDESVEFSLLHNINIDYQAYWRSCFCIFR